MPIDFSRLAVGRHAVLISPRDIFASLPGRAAGFGYLRDVQGQVLGAWERRRTERDLPITMNTGTGKTVAGLLMLQSSLNEGAGPALYVAPDNYLARQVRQQAQAGLGIDTGRTAASMPFCRTGLAEPGRPVNADEEVR